MLRSLFLTAILILPGLLILPVLDGELLVSGPSNIIIVDGSGGQDHISIQDAVDSADPGDTILIWDGTYIENVVINKSITLIGNGTKNSIINGVEADVIMVLADHVNISGLSITNSDLLYSGINLMNSSGSTISNCSFSSNLYGVRMKGSSNMIMDCEFDDNVYGASIGRYPRDVLLMGNSYTYGNNLDQLVERLFKNSINDADTQRLTNGGLNLSNHASMALSPGHQWNTTLNSGDNWDHVVLQDQSQIPGFPTSSSYWKESLAGAKVLNSMIKEVGGETVFLMTWGRRFGDPSNSWRYPDYLSMQKHLENGYRWFADNVSTEDRPAYVAPVGLAWKYIYDMVNQTGDPTALGTLFYDLYTGDNSHPSLFGSYLASCVIYATITGDSPIGLTDGLTISSVRRLALQKAAHETVFNGTPDYVYPWQDNSRNGIYRSKFIENDIGVAIGPGSNENMIIGNNFSMNNDLGVLITDSTCSQNEIYQNDLLFTAGGVVQAKDNGVNNSWDDGNKGNYWSDLLDRYPEATPSGEVWDTPYVIDTIRNISDRYPLFDPIRDQDIIPPVAIAGEDRSVYEGSIVELDGGASFDDRGIVNYTWSFEFDGINVEIFGEVVEFNFTLVGKYPVQLIVQDLAGNNASDEVNITVLERIMIDTTPPIPPTRLDLDRVIESGTYVDLIAGNWTDEESLISDFQWIFFYGGSEKVLHRNHTGFRFDIPGDHLITLKVTNEANLSTEILFWINVTYDGVKPHADGGSDITIDQHTMVVFNSSGSSDESGISSYNWSFFDKEQIILSGISPNYTFHNAGIYPVKFNVSDPNGNWALDHFIITVNDTTYPYANAGMDQIIGQWDKVNFDASGSSDNIGIVRYEWTFVDEEQITLMGPGPGHTFRYAGIYVITLVTSDEAGNYAIDTINITVLDTTKPMSLVLPDSHRVVRGTQLRIDGSGSSDNVGIVNWTWKVGDDEYYTPIIYLTFDNAGNHTVTLIITDAAGNSADNMQIIHVVDIPQIIPPDEEKKDGKKETSILVYISLGSLFILLVVLIIILFFRKDSGEVHVEE